ncbi:MAG: DUF896 domain-containing protein [Cellulosilyticaceae bacterium]
MEMEQLIARINVLANKQKGEGLTENEKAEQQALRKEYLTIFKSNFKSQLENTKIKTPDGQLHPLKYAPESNQKSN